VTRPPRGTAASGAWSQTLGEHHPATEVGHVVPIPVTHTAEEQGAEEQHGEDGDYEADRDAHVTRDQSGDCIGASLLAGLLDLDQTDVSEDDGCDSEGKRDDPSDRERGDAGDHGPEGELVCWCGGRDARGGRSVLGSCHVLSLRVDAWSLL